VTEWQALWQQRQAELEGGAPARAVRVSKLQTLLLLEALAADPAVGGPHSASAMARFRPPAPAPAIPEPPADCPRWVGDPLGHRRGEPGALPNDTQGSLRLWGFCTVIPYYDWFTEGHFWLSLLGLFALLFDHGRLGRRCVKHYYYEKRSFARMARTVEAGRTALPPLGEDARGPCRGCGLAVVAPEVPVLTLTHVWHGQCLRCYACDACLGGDVTVPQAEEAHKVATFRLRFLSAAVSTANGAVDGSPLMFFRRCWRRRWARQWPPAAAAARVVHGRTKEALAAVQKTAPREAIFDRDCTQADDEASIEELARAAEAEAEAEAEAAAQASGASSSAAAAKDRLVMTRAEKNALAAAAKAEKARLKRAAAARKAAAKAEARRAGGQGGGDDGAEAPPREWKNIPACSKHRCTRLAQLSEEERRRLRVYQEAEAEISGVAAAARERKELAQQERERAVREERQAKKGAGRRAYKPNGGGDGDGDGNGGGNGNGGGGGGGGVGGVAATKGPLHRPKGEVIGWFTTLPASLRRVSSGFLGGRQGKVAPRAAGVADVGAVTPSEARLFDDEPLRPSDEPSGGPGAGGKGKAAAPCPVEAALPAPTNPAQQPPGVTGASGGGGGGGRGAGDGGSGGDAVTMFHRAASVSGDDGGGGGGGSGAGQPGTPPGTTPPGAAEAEAGAAALAADLPDLPGGTSMAGTPTRQKSPRRQTPTLVPLDMHPCLDPCCHQQFHTPWEMHAHYNQAHVVVYDVCHL
jgi:hypothetical protein